ncbi:MAG: hypothetical protein H8D63_00235 [Parcubacteria group bacterium]|nr:hypothetical protein [Parcubacteria group bacterium]
MRKASLTFFVFLLGFIFIGFLSSPFPVHAQGGEECFERGEGWWSVLPDEFFDPWLEGLVYQIDGNSIGEGDGVPKDLFSSEHAHMISWNENGYAYILQVYSGVQGNANMIAQMSIGYDSPESVDMSDVPWGAGEHFLVVFQKKLPVSVEPAPDPVPTGGDIIIHDPDVDLNNSPLFGDGPTPHEIKEYGHIWNRRYFETGEVLWCGIESDKTSTIPITTLWASLSFFVTETEYTVPTLSYATSTPYESNGMYPNKAVADEDELTFAVVYTDMDNDAPEYVRTWVKDNEGTDSFLDMTAANQTTAGADAPATPNPDLTDGNYQNGELFTATSTFPKGEYVYTFLTKENTDDAEEQSFPAPTPEDSELTFKTGYSSVAFLPGIGGSRLYTERGNGEMVWEPNDLADIDQVAVDPITGKSIDPNIAVKGLTDEILLRLDAWPTTNVYKSFMQYMDDEVEGRGLIAEWKPLAYDWRLGFDELLSHGNLIGTDNGVDVVLFSETADTPYLIYELERMARLSDSGKITILTHSNGGLLAKYLLAQLEKENNSLLDSIDDVILVASPQLGTPEAAATLLHGTTKFGKGKERDTAENMESAYHLLPSYTYFETVSDPVFEFSDEVDEIPELIDFVGEIIGGSGAYTAFIDFLTGHGGTWDEPTDVDAPNVLKDDQLAYAQRMHAVIDNWIPPEHIDVIQIAGFGLDTTYAIQYDDCDIPFCEDSLETLDRKLLKTAYGDGTVVLPSAIAMGDTDGVETYYVNLDEHNSFGEGNRNRKHASILEVNKLKDFLANLFIGSRYLEEYIYGTLPFSAKTKNVHITMHSPVDIHAYVGGLHTGLVGVEGSDIRYYEEEIPNSSYSEWSESKEITVPYGEEIILSLEGYDEGTFTLEIEEREGDEVLAYTIFSDVPIMKGDVGDIVFHDIDDVTELALDTDGDGNSDEYVFTDDEISYDTLRAMIKESEMSNLQTKLFLKQIDVIEKLHDKGNVIAAKATLLALQKQIENVSCTTMKQKWGKRVCVPEKDVNRVSTMIDALVKKLEQPVQEKRDKVKEKVKSWMEKLKERLKR